MARNLSRMPSSKISSYMPNSIAPQDRIAAATYAVGTNSSGRVAGTAAQAGRMADYDITPAGRVVTVVQNGRTIIDKQEFQHHRRSLG